MKTSDFYYDLPKSLIAQTPMEPRDHSRLMVMDRAGNIQHRLFKDITDYLNAGDVLIVNDTKVLPARLFGETEHGGAMEFLLLKRLDQNRWEVLVKPGKKAKPGAQIRFGGGELTATIESTTDAGGRVVCFRYDGVFEQILDRLGTMPLPPYITQKLEDQTRYQTVYARREGSAAAPTAGLHFTDRLLEELRQKGIKIVPILLHVGLGTFRPVKVEEISEHHMHSEYFEVTEEAARAINDAKQNGKKVICTGTTSVRTVESAWRDGKVCAMSGWTDIFITPGYEFHVPDALITNFHLPESTLMMLVSAFSGYENIMNAYRIAVQEKYRFFSFGDACYLERKE